ncbi:MAG: hypothetical protein J5819_02760 [Eubacterium sp.]|nr:hypothetical protein [Eubacterium sp.]
MNESYNELAKSLGVYLLNDEQIPLAAKCNAEAYEGYELYDILFKNHCTPAKVERLWTVSINQVKDRALIIGDGPKVNGMAIFMPPGYTTISVSSFLKAGGLKLPFNIISGLNKYQKYTADLRARHTQNKAWYLLDLAIRPSANSHDLADKMLTPVLDYIRDEGRGCFVETQEEMEIGFFEHFGFEVVETGRIPGSDSPLYGMYRYPEEYRYSDDDRKSI